MTTKTGKVWKITMVIEYHPNMLRDDPEMVFDDIKAYMAVPTIMDVFKIIKLQASPAVEVANDH